MPDSGCDCTESNGSASAGSLSAMADPTPVTRRSTKWQIDRLDQRERRFSYVAAGMAVVFGVAIYLVQTNNHKFRLAKGQITPQTTLVLGIACGALLVIATLIGRRAPVGFVALFTFLGFGTTDFALGAPFLLLAGWLLYRSYKFQKEAGVKLRAANAEAAAGAPAGERPATRGTATRRPAARGTTAPGKTSGGTAPGKSRSKGPSTPEANKRFTPNRPPPPAPKPSRRERKATQSTD
jgi:hypothetical protein